MGNTAMTPKAIALFIKLAGIQTLATRLAAL